MTERVVILKGFDEALTSAPLNTQVLRIAEVRAMRFTALFLQSELQKRIPVKTGQTRSRISTRIARRGFTVEGIVGGKSIAPGGYNILLGLEQGTGLFGPRKKRIRPLSGPFDSRAALRFTVGGSPVAGAGGEAIFRKSVAGMRPRRPFRRTKREEGDKARRLFVRQLVKEVNKT